MSIRIVASRRRKRWAVVAAAAGVVALVSGACTDTRGGVTVTDSAGVRLVRRFGPVTPLPWRLDTVRVLGGAPEGPEGFFRVWPSLVDVDAQGRMYVLDESQYHVVVFDSTGAVLTVLGNEGDGPGELRFPVSLSASDQGVVSVFDGAKQALVRFVPDGSVLEQTKFPYTVINLRFPQFHIEPDGLVVWARASIRTLGEGQGRMDRLMHVTAGDSTLLIPPQPDHTGTAHFDECGVTFTMRVPLSPFPRWSQSGRRMAVNDWPEYRIEVFDGADRVASIRSDDVGPVVDAAGAVRLLKSQGLEGGPCNTTPKDLVERYGFSSRPQVIANLTVTPDGGLWVEAGTSYGDRRIDVFDGGGGYTGSLDGAFPMPLAFLPDGRPIIPISDSLDVERLGITTIVVHRSSPAS